MRFKNIDISGIGQTELLISNRVSKESAEQRLKRDQISTI